MSAKRENTAIVGVGVAACAACCAGPILGALAAIGLGTAAGVAMFGAIAVLIGVAAAGIVIVRRRRRSVACSSGDPTAAVQVELRATSARS